MKNVVSIIYVASLLLGIMCPMQMTAAIPMPTAPMQHEEVMAMTPMVSMTLAFPMSMHPTTHASDTMPVLPSRNCTTGHCMMMSHSNQQPASFSTFTVQLASSAALPVVLSPVTASSDSRLTSSDIENIYLAQTISTVVLRA